MPGLCTVVGQARKTGLAAGRWHLQTQICAESRARHARRLHGVLQASTRKRSDI